MKVLFKATDIDWDIDGVEGVDHPAELELPYATTIEAADEDSVIDALSDRYGYCIHRASIEVAKKYVVHGWGPDDLGSFDDFDTLDEVREYLKGRIEYYDGKDGGHNDYRHFHCIGFKLPDIGCTADEHYEMHWCEWPIKPLLKFTADLSRMESAQVEVEAVDEDEATEKVKQMLDHEDCSNIEWTRLRRSEVIDSVNESEPF